MSVILSVEKDRIFKGEDQYLILSGIKTNGAKQLFRSDFRYEPKIKSKEIEIQILMQIRNQVTSLIDKMILTLSTGEIISIDIEPGPEGGERMGVKKHEIDFNNVEYGRNI